ncbi:MAG TPA: helix-turn-helix domain-containing protein [Magnetospirillum sp.]|nr:helix-turn-helix domain-containing protein [Magnetospirillum sp.]
MGYRRKTISETPQGHKGLSPIEAAERLGIAPQTLAHYRVKGCGPRYIRISSRCIRYLEADLSAWLDMRAQASTAENGQD